MQNKPDEAMLTRLKLGAAARAVDSAGVEQRNILEIVDKIAADCAETRRLGREREGKEFWESIDEEGIDA